MGAIHGLAAKQGETAFAFLVVKLRTPVGRAGLIQVIEHLGSIVPDAESLIGELPDELEPAMYYVGAPWSPPESELALREQRERVAACANLGLEHVWFFQTGTSLPPPQRHPDGNADRDAADAAADDVVDDFAWEDELPAGDFVAEAWSFGPPPQCTTLPFPVDGYPEILATHDWEDFGLALKFAGPWEPGETAVLLGFHALWLGPYAGRYRNAAVTIDRSHHAAHFWVDRFVVPTEIEQQVHHLLWIAARLHEVLPVLHARFGGATLPQKQAPIMGGTREPFVLGGNPLLAVHATGGEPALDAWIATQTAWSKEEIAHMLRELAIEIVSHRVLDEDADDDGDDDDDDRDGDGDDEPDDDYGGGRDDREHPRDDPEDGHDDDDDDDDDDGDGAEGDDEEDRGRHIASYAGEVLAIRAAAGLLDPRAADLLRPILEVSSKHEHRRRAVIDVLAAARDRAAIPSLIRILDDNPIGSFFDSAPQEYLLALRLAGVGKDELVTTAVEALGKFACPSAIPSLSRVVAAKGTHNDRPRPAAANALARCLAATPEPREVADEVFAGLLSTIEERNDGALNAESHLAYGRIARLLGPERRTVLVGRLDAAVSRRTDALTALARHGGLALAAHAPSDHGPDALRDQLRRGLTTMSWDHDTTIRDLSIVLQVAEIFTGLVEPADLVWLTRFVERDVRDRAHALLDRLGHPMPPAASYDPSHARSLDDLELLRALDEPHVIGKSALVAEAAARQLAPARPAVVRLVESILAHAPERHDLLDPETRILEAAVHLLRVRLDAPTIALFDRMLRHPNTHIKWALLKDPPHDERLIAGMVHVRNERWGWQESAAEEWLEQFVGSAAYERERARAAVASVVEPDPETDDQSMN